ncbi:MAG: MATE family efflux transporter, partial [Oceanisphaera sp.]
EAMVGKAVGARNRAEFRLACALNVFWGLVVALVFVLIFSLFGSTLIQLITSITEVQNQARMYLPWLMLMPLAACWCFILDGIFIGTTRGADMRDMMLVSTFGVFFPVWFIAQSLGNHGLWLAMSLFMLARGITLAWAWWRIENRQGFISDDSYHDITM